MNFHEEKAALWIVDFGSQYTQLITRQCRQLRTSSSIFTLERVRELFSQGCYPQGLILSGGPQSIFDDQDDYAFLFANKDLPILGICYGMQVMAAGLGGRVEKGVLGEYGHSTVHFNPPLPGLPAEINSWMSHSDHVTDLPQDFRPLAHSENGLLAMMEHRHHPWVGLQFHLEVQHTEHGTDLLAYLLQERFQLQADWDAQEMVSEAMDYLQAIPPTTSVLCAFSGGVDSLVAATLAQKVFGASLHCFFIDNGLLRPQDLTHMLRLQESTPLQIHVIDARELFLNNLAGVQDPEQKRKVIGKTFIEVFDQQVHQFEREKGIRFEYLLQGTLYPDVIESLSPHQQGGKSATIKSHHNVGGLPERMNLKLLEPLRFFFKDEVRQIGETLGLEHQWLYRHPFPGPGLGVRILGEITPEKVRMNQQADQILFEELKRQNLYDQTWQALTVFLPVQTVGVKGDRRAYEEVICVRMVNSLDGMTAKFTEVPFSFLAKLSHRMTNEIAGITRVVYDITSKPPGTIEWE